jgi:imidazolonepropionase-like amidohydrolase
VLKISRLPLCSLLFAALAGHYTVAADDRATVVIHDISVLAPSAAGWLTHRDIVVRGTTISAIQATGGNVPAAKVVINGSGKFVVPGLFDNRVHLADMTRDAAGLFVAYGVTSVDAGADSPRITEWRREIANGKFMGPRIVEAVAGARDVSPGSNAGSARIAPGQALHDELSRLVSGGLTPADALRRVTIESARAHGRDRDLGSIEIGKIADLLILTGDPLSDITRTRAIDAVVFRGEALTRAHLNLLLAKAPAAPAGR